MEPESTAKVLTFDWLSCGVKAGGGDVGGPSPPLPPGPSNGGGDVGGPPCGPLKNGGKLGDDPPPNGGKLGVVPPPIGLRIILFCCGYEDKSL